jgi:hypothetical protein
LTTGDVGTALGNLSLQPFRTIFNEFAGLGDIGCQLEDLIRGVFISIAQVAFDRTGEQVALLGDVTDRADRAG